MRVFSIYISGVGGVTLPPLGSRAMAYLLFGLLGAGLAWEGGLLLHLYHLLFLNTKYKVFILLMKML
jgi:hypothetical protein